MTLVNASNQAMTIEGLLSLCLAASNLDETRGYRTGFGCAKYDYAGWLC